MFPAPTDTASPTTSEAQRTTVFYEDCDTCPEYAPIPALGDQTPGPIPKMIFMTRRSEVQPR